MARYKVTATEANVWDNKGVFITSYKKGYIVTSDNRYSDPKGVKIKLSKPINKKIGYMDLIQLNKVPTGVVNTSGIAYASMDKEAKILKDSKMYNVTLETAHVSYKVYKDDIVIVKRTASTGALEVEVRSGKGIGLGWINSSLVNYKFDISSDMTDTIKEDAAHKKEITKVINDMAKTFDVVTAKYDTKLFEKMMVKNLNGIHGVPYQFMDLTDMRIGKGSNIGRKYAEKIVTRMPLLLLSPGSPNFLPTFNAKERKAILSTLIGSTTPNVRRDLDTLLGKEGRYYTFKFAYKDYFKYVNTMLRMSSLYLGLQQTVHGNGISNGYQKQLQQFDWAKAGSKELKGYINSAEYVAFYMDSDTSATESIDNTTDQSELLPGFASSAQGLAKEIQFLAGPVAGLKIEAADPENFDAAKANIDKIVGKHFNNNRLLKSIAEQLTTIGKGGNLIFPEVWKDSDSGKPSYNVTIKLRTPDGDKLSWYLNIMVPLIHLLGMAAPRELGANGYMSPFLVRAYAKGLFSIDMGMITSMNVTKGKEASWTLDGLPTEVDISLTIKEMYNRLTISKPSENLSLLQDRFLNNTALMDYLATSCGVNINKPDVQRQIQTYTALAQSKAEELKSGFGMTIQENLSNTLLTAYNKFARR